MSYDAMQLSEFMKCSIRAMQVCQNLHSSYLFFIQCAYVFFILFLLGIEIQVLYLQGTISQESSPHFLL